MKPNFTSKRRRSAEPVHPDDGTGIAGVPLPAYHAALLDRHSANGIDAQGIICVPLSGYGSLPASQRLRGHGFLAERIGAH
jgi:hypothetical protein